jgi:hypothetical protein
MGEDSYEYQDNREQTQGHLTKKEGRTFRSGGEGDALLPEGGGTHRVSRRVSVVSAVLVIRAVP